MLASDWGRGKIKNIEQFSVTKKGSYKSRYGLYASTFVNKDDPNYRYSYGTKYTERQMRILDGSIPLEDVRLNELKIIMKKAEGINDIDTADKALEMYNDKKDPDRYHPQISYEDALRILDELDK